MDCKNCEYGLKQHCGDFEKILCTYEEGECVKITELEQQIKKMKRHSNCKHRNEYNEFNSYSKVCQSCCNLEKWEFGN